LVRNGHIDWDVAMSLRSEGWTFAAIAQEAGYSYKTIRQGLRSRGAKGRRTGPRGEKARRLRGVWRLVCPRLDLDVALEHRELSLGPAQISVRQADLSRHRDESIGEALVDLLNPGDGGLVVATHRAEDFDLPTRLRRPVWYKSGSPASG
jgi:hypothetical protein